MCHRYARNYTALPSPVPASVKQQNVAGGGAAGLMYSFGPPTYTAPDPYDSDLLVAPNVSLAMRQPDQMTLTFRCPPELDKILPRPIPAVQGLPDWYKALPSKVFNPTIGIEEQTVKKCPPFIDAMTYGFLIPLPVDVEVRDGEFTWNFQMPEGFSGEYSHSPIDFHNPSQISGTPFFDDDRFIIKFNNFWSIKAPEGYSVLFTHPVNRSDLPFTTLTGLVDCDVFSDSPVNFPARWHDAGFNGVLPKGTPVAQCIPVKRELWSGRFEWLSAEDTTRLLELRRAVKHETDTYRRQFRAPKR
jgi:hypothetical protein